MSKLSTFTILLVLVASNIFLGVQSADPACSQTPGVEGPCRAEFQRYSFYGSSCKLFYYGGCQGNDNNFKTLEACEKACLS